MDISDQIRSHTTHYLDCQKNWSTLIKGAFIYDFWVGKQVGQASSDFTKQAYVLSKVSDERRQVGQKCPKNI